MDELLHPLPSVNEYMILYGPPTPATDGVKLFPEIPEPLNVPPTGVPVNVAAGSLTL